MTPEFWTELLVGTLTAVIGTGGLMLIYNLKWRILPWALLAAAIGYITYEITDVITESVFVSSLVAAALTAFYADIIAHVIKTPATVVLIPGIVPLVPGGMLYYTMLGILKKSPETVSKYGIGALQTALGIAVGIVFMTLLTRTLIPKFIIPIHKKEKK